MKIRSSILLAALLAVAAASWAQQAKTKPAHPPHRNAADTEEAIKKKLEYDRNDAIIHSDVATLDRLSAADYTLIDVFGANRTKPDLLKSFQSGDIKIPSRSVEDLNVRAFGNTAVVTGRVTQQGTSAGKDISGQYRFTRVYTQGKSGWQAVAAQETRVAQ